MTRARMPWVTRTSILVGLGLASAAAGFVADVDARPQPRQEEVQAMPYYCPPVQPPPQVPWSGVFSPTGGYWSIEVPLAAHEASCTWRAASGREQAASLVHYPARVEPQLLAHDGWTWFSAEPALDVGESWTLECRWLPIDCAPPSCPDGGYLVSVGPRPVLAPQTPAPSLALQPSLETDGCHGGGPFLRLRGSGVVGSDMFWSEGGVLRVGYPDGSWALALPDYDGVGERFTALPPPHAGEGWIGLELVDGGGAVVQAWRIELAPEFWQVVTPPEQGAWDGGRGDPYGTGGPAAEPARGCHKK